MLFDLNMRTWLVSSMVSVYLLRARYMNFFFFKWNIKSRLYQNIYEDKYIVLKFDYAFCSLLRVMVMNYAKSTAWNIANRRPSRYSHRACYRFPPNASPLLVVHRPGEEKMIDVIRCTRGSKCGLEHISWINAMWMEDLSYHLNALFPCWFSRQCF